jgi:hypothetical protein
MIPIHVRIIFKLRISKVFGIDVHSLHSADFVEQKKHDSELGETPHQKDSAENH